MPLLGKADLGQKLAKRRSQDFNSKIQGWLENGGGAVEQEEISAASVPELDLAEKSKAKPKIVTSAEVKVHKRAVSTPVKPIKDNGDGDDGEEAAAAAKSAAKKEKRSSGLAQTPRKVSPTSAAIKKALGGMDAEKRAWVRHKSRPAEDLVPELDAEIDVKHAATPKRRVVSDNNWRRDRPAKETVKAKEPTSPKQKDSTPKPVIIRRSIVNVGLKTRPTPGAYGDDSEPERVRLRPRRRTRSSSRSRSGERRNITPDFESRGTKVFVSRPKPSRSHLKEPKPTDRRSYTSSFTETTSTEKRRTADYGTPATSISDDARTHRERRSPLKVLVDDDDKSQNMPGAFPRVEEDDVPTPDHKRNLRHALHDPRESSTPRTKANDTRSRNYTEPVPKTAARSITPIVPPVYGSRIEGWLADTSDPFVEASSPVMESQPISLPKRVSRDIGSPEARSRTLQLGSEVSRERGRRASGGITQSIDEWSEISPSMSASIRRTPARRTRTPAFDRRSRDRRPVRDVSPPKRASADIRSGRAHRSPERAAQHRHATNGRESPNASGASSPSRPSNRVESFEGPCGHDNYHEETVLSRASDGRLHSREKDLKRGLTKHRDLMSVLSVDRDDERIIRSRTLRASRRQRPDPNTVGELMNSISKDELKYQRELRTLVDGVIPVLLQYALAGKDEDGQSPGGSQANRPSSVTKPIMNMGIALERLKSTHRRIPMHEPSELILWAEDAVKIYSEYFSSWRMGFKDIIVNLAPADSSHRDRSPAWVDGVARNKQGDLLGGDGERVDVAHLLKRPLVRVKHLAKSLDLLKDMRPSQDADRVARLYAGLVEDAKHRVNSETARLEDEAAAGIDASRARDPRSLAPIAGVSIDPTRRVRARDYFDMELMHSSGQQVCCKIEIIYRDDAPGRGSAGDVLFCEVSTTGRWLLFPPLPLSLVSARNSQKSGELIVMIRGFLASAQQWREVMTIRAEEEQTGDEWLQMLGSSPMPPAQAPTPSAFATSDQLTVARLDNHTSRSESTIGPSQRELEVPLGEKTHYATSVWDGSDVNSVSDYTTSTGLQRSNASRQRSGPSSPVVNPTYPPTESGHSPRNGHYLGRSQQERYYSKLARQPESSHARSRSETVTSGDSSRIQDHRVWSPGSQRSRGSSQDDDARTEREVITPGSRHRKSSVSSIDMPRIPRLRRSGASSTSLRGYAPRRVGGEVSDHEDYPGRPLRRVGDEVFEDYDYRARTPRRVADEFDDCDDPASAPAKVQRRSFVPPSSKDSGQPQRRAFSFGLKSGILPSLKPAFLRKDRRPSSPLKHAYEPSSADSLSESDLSDGDYEDSVTSESTADAGEQREEIMSTIGDLKAFQEYAARPTSQPALGSRSLPPIPTENSVPRPHAFQHWKPPSPMAAAQRTKIIAGIFSWSERGMWESLHPEECLIFVTPGLIEAFDMTQAAEVFCGHETGAQISPSTHGVRPLVALELTPLVPLRRGTAVDISIRSPPSAGSLIRTGSNVMFRSRNPDDCEKLYFMINRARIDNPTYIALQNARSPLQQSNWSDAMDQRNAARSSSGSWWQLGSRRGSTYRSKASRTASVAVTDSSVGTMNSAFSALRRFSGSNRIWNIAKSTIHSRQGTRSSHSESLSSGVTSPIELDPRLGTPLGITNAQIRLYIRESAQRWKDMGAARLTVLLPPRQDPAIAANPRATGLEKRVLIYGKDQDEVLLDATLAEHCFERVARTGIAVSVWKENQGPNGELGHAHAVGGVGPAHTSVYMIQMKSERDAAYTFGLVGKLRY